MPEHPVDSHNDLRSLILQRSATTAHAPYLISAIDASVLNYRDLEESTSEFIKRFQEWGARPGDRIGLLVVDPVLAAQSMLAMISMGLWVAPLDPTIVYASGSQIDERVRLLELRAILADRVLSFDVDTAWLALDARHEWTPQPSRDRAISKIDGGIILSSSGTTGTPKVMGLSTHQLLEAARNIARHNELSSVDRGFNSLPLWHVNAVVVGLLSTLVSGASLVLDAKFHRTEFWSKAEGTGATWINAVPAIIARLSELQEGETVPDSIRFVRSASAPLSSAQLERFEAATGIPVIETYGMTEAASQICANPLEGPRKAGSVGRPVGVELRITDLEPANENRTLGARSSGQVEIRGSSVIDHYESPGYEERFDAERWLRTGDVGYLDEDGYLFLAGRIDDVINRGGEKIMPRELEDVALGVDGVLGAAVVPRDDDVYGQVPELFVQLRGVTSSTPIENLAMLTKELHDVLTSSFSRARQPSAISVVEAMPANATGKVQKRELASGQTKVLYRLPNS